MITNLTPEQYQAEKIRIITLMFEPYNSNDYKQNENVSKDILKNYIDFQMFRNFIPNSSNIQEDVYQIVFENLLKLNPKATKKFVDEYYKNPKNVYWLSKTIAKLKGFAVSSGTPRPNHSLAKSIVYASAFAPKNEEINYTVNGVESG